MTSCRKSNVKLVSNVYHRTGTLKNDREFVRRVHGRKALAKVVRHLYEDLVHPEEKIKQPDFSEIQEKEWNEQLACSLDPEKRFSFGVVMYGGKAVIECRCEYTECPRFRECRPGVDSEEIRKLRGDNTSGSREPLPFTEETDLPLPVVWPVAGISEIQSPDGSVASDPQTETKLTGEVPEVLHEDAVADSIVDGERVEKTDLERCLFEGVWGEGSTPQEDDSLKKDRGLCDPLKEGESEDNHLDEIIPVSCPDTQRAGDDPENLFDIAKEVNQEEIIFRDPEACSFVIAGPGTGKTYSVIEKLAALVEQYGVSPSEILVLCFTRAAVHEIQARLMEKVKQDAVSDLDFMEVRTFDSFATLALRYCEPDTTLQDLNYDQRVEKCTETLERNPEALSPFKHIIIDEVQDLVGCRANFVLSILGCCFRHGSGFTLFGDPLQSIYDYQVRGTDQPDSVAFVRDLRKKFGEVLNICKYTTVYRYNGPNSSTVDSFRSLLESVNTEPDDYQKKQIASLINDIEQIGKFNNFNLEIGHKKTAFLCRSNALALILSQTLRRRNIKHRLLKRSRRNNIPGWIAEIMNSISGTVLTRNEFISQLENSILIDNKYRASEYWKSAIVISNGTESRLEAKKFNAALARGGYQTAFDLNREDRLEDNHVVVSTIHKSKGREYDIVVLAGNQNINEKYITLDEGKVYYVCLSRAKEQVFNIFPSRRCRFHRTDMGRNFQIAKISGKYDLGGIEIGMAGDVDGFSFVSTEVFGSPERVLENQKYLIENVRPGDSVCVEFRETGSRKCMAIVHEGHLIGTLSNDFIADLKNVMQRIFRKEQSFNIPNLKEIFVQDLFTMARIPETLDPKRIPGPFCDSGFWIGVELSGFARPVME